MSSLCKRARWSIAGLGLVAAMALPARSESITFTQVIDLSTASIDGTAGSGQSFSRVTSSPTQSVAIGDVVTVNYTFTNGSLQLSETSTTLSELAPWVRNAGTQQNFTINNISLQLVGFTGSAGVSSTYLSSQQTAGQAHLGPYFSGVLSGNSFMQFTGISTTFTVSNLTAASPNRYGGDFLTISAQTIQVIPNAVPEPSTLVSCGIGGLFALGYGCRRKSGRASRRALPA